MAVTKKNGSSGKPCTICKNWRMLIDFPFDKRPGRFKGYRQSICNDCAALMKAQEKMQAKLRVK
jgi:hypothetical protein